MLHVLAFTISITFALFVSASDVRAQNNGSEANKLFVEAVKLYRQSEEMTGSAKLEAYEEVRSLFDQILSDYPESKPAKVISQGGSPGGVTIASLPSSKPKGWNNGKRGIVRDLLVKYDNDIGAIEAVAEAAGYAHLAWAAYDADEPKQFLEQRGWKLLEAYKGDRALVGDVTARLYEGPHGQHVLTFRGSVTGGDWVKNVGGTLSPTPLLNGQVIDALNLADEIVQKFPDVVFVGHSLGGRLAQASSLKTGNLAFAFNSAPVGYNEIRQMGFQDLIQGKMRRFRSPQDQLSGVFTPSDTVVANIEEVDANALFNLVNAKDYTHAMNVLADAMQSVAIAWSQGWVSAYLDEQKAADTTLEKSEAEQNTAIQISGHTCSIGQSPMTGDAIKSNWIKKQLTGLTASGASWKLVLDGLQGDETGKAVFTNSKNEVVSGLWKPDSNGICQSYNGGSSWVCHRAYKCTNEESEEFALQNSENEFSSIVAIGSGVEPSEVANAAELPRSNSSWSNESAVREALSSVLNRTEPRTYDQFPEICRGFRGPLTQPERKVLFDNTRFTLTSYSTSFGLKKRDSWEAYFTDGLANLEMHCLGEDFRGTGAFKCEERYVKDHHFLQYCPAKETFFAWGRDRIFEISNVSRVAPFKIGNASYALSEGKKLRVTGQNCFFHAPWDKPTSVDWSGKCVDGKPTGTGTIKWRENGEIIWKSRVGPEWGLVLKDGKLWIEYDFSNFVLNIGQCNFSDYQRGMVVRIPKGTRPELFRNSWLTYHVLEKAAAHLVQGCKHKGRHTYSGIWVNLYIEGPKDLDTGTWQGAIVTSKVKRGSDVSSPDWERVNNTAIATLNKEIERDNAAEREAERAEERRQAQLRAQRQAAARRQGEARRQQAAREAAAKKQAELAALQRQIEQQWASRMEDMFTGQYVIENVGDLLQYNKAKAISLLSQGVTLQLATQNMSFQDGTVIIAHEHDPTDVLKPVRDAARAQMDTLTAWMDTTSNVGRDYSGPSINVVCRLSASALEQLDGKTTARFDAKMQTLNGRSAVFDCKLKR
jgi:hypothetical protein